jgi:hypothetical protein
VLVTAFNYALVKEFKQEGTHYNRAFTFEDGQRALRRQAQGLIRILEVEHR